MSDKRAVDPERLIKQKQDAAFRLFEYLYLLRYGRGPYAWEWMFGWAFIRGDVCVVHPVESDLLSSIHATAHDVAIALNMLERKPQ